MRRAALSFSIAVLTAAALIGAAPAQAKATTKNLTFPVDLTSSGTVLETLPGDITYGWNDLQGPTRWGKKDASLRFLGSVDYVNGNGPFGGFVTVTRADGTRLGLSVSGWATTPSDQTGTANATFRGAVSVIGGSGPYAGATGVGTMKGYRKAALGSPVQLTFSLTVSVPRT
ncbi:MAG: hypothetical protein FJW80_11235 [Actinobacteria bacterium]|nr:hypothetical protein [Actinomycetota bacterium]